MTSLLDHLWRNDPAFRQRAERLSERLSDENEPDAVATRAMISNLRAGDGPRIERATPSFPAGAGPVGAGPEGGADFFDPGPRVEAIVLLDQRPSFLLENNAPPETSDPLWSAVLAQSKDRIAHVAPLVGHVELVEMGHDRPIGTCWILDESGLAVTNRHVAEDFARMEGGRFVLAKSVSGDPLNITANFNGEAMATADRLAQVVEITHVEGFGDNTAPDLAILKLSGDAPMQPLLLASSDPPADMPIGTIGFPARGASFNFKEIRARREVFGDSFNVKRFAPGHRHPPTGLDVEWAFGHDCSTLGGASGSPVFDLETGRVIGVHFMGWFMNMNYAVRLPVLKNILAEQSITVPVGPLPGPVPTDPDTPDPTPAPASDDPVRAPANETGYDPDFLGRPVPAPSLDNFAVGEVLETSPGQSLLHYTHFSLAMHKARKLAIFTACNVDGSDARRVPRQRRWFLDARIPAEAQHGDALYKNNPYDRGHLVRRNDPVWGDKAADANSDTFFFTNAAPQHADLNQRIWLDLEDYILDTTKAAGMRVSVFTGPVFDPADPVERGVQIPRRFWKLVAFVEGDALRSAAYLMDQSQIIAPLHEAAFGAFGTYQVSVDLVQRMTKLDFGALAAADVLLNAPASEAPDEKRLLKRVEDMFLG